MQLNKMKNIILIILTLISASFFFDCQSKPKPTPEAIIAKYIAAVGGKEKLKQIKSVKVKAIVTGPQIKFNTEVIIQAPDKLYMYTEVAGQKNIFVLNGQKGAEWTDNQKKDVSPEVVKTLHDDCYIYSYLYYQQWQYKLAAIEDKKIDGKDSYGVKVTNGDNQAFNLYFDKENGLLLERQLPSLQNVIYKIKSYKQVDGVLYPHISETTYASGEKFITENFYVKFNEQTDQKIFSLNK
jgi:hypothetical protein